MDVEIKEKFQNKLLGRQEISFGYSFAAAAPSRADVRGALSAALGAKPELLVIERMVNKYGLHSGNGRAFVFDSKEKVRIGKHLLVRDGLAEKKKKEKKAKAAPAKK
jgi:ribosomal protein S24E